MTCAAHQSLPDGVERYRDLGPFDAQSVPKGLLVEHRLKAGTWGRLTVRAGSVRLIWDDCRAGPAVTLGAGAEAVIPPEIPHHLEIDGAFEILIAFYR
jgi:tellurite resistance-related uncharacterized protein